MGEGGVVVERDRQRGGGETGNRETRARSIKEGEKAGDGADKRRRRWRSRTCTCSQVGRKGLR